MATAQNPNAHYAEANGVNIYYEVYGSGQPLILLHGAFSATGSSFGQLIPLLEGSRQVISVELQGHGHTADIDRPLTIPSMAEDVAALMGKIGIEQADVFGYSMGAGVALQLAISHPELVRKLALASVTYNQAGMHPGLMDGLDQLQPEWLIGTPWHDEYMASAPDPNHFPAFVEKVKEMNRNIPDMPAASIRALPMPVMLIIADSDIVTPEHAVEMFRLLGGGVSGDNAGLPKSRLAILPATSHSTVPTRAAWIAPLLTDFLDAPLPAATKEN